MKIVKDNGIYKVIRKDNNKYVLVIGNAILSEKEYEREHEAWMSRKTDDILFKTIVYVAEAAVKNYINAKKQEHEIEIETNRQAKENS